MASFLNWNEATFFPINLSYFFFKIEDDHSPEYSFDTNIGFSIEVYNFEKSRYIQVFQTDNINKFKEPMGYFPDYDLIIDCNQVDSFHIQLILQKKNSIDVDTFHLSAQEKIIELYRNKI